MALAAGQPLSFYEILGPLGAGAMGEVYRARDTRLDREVAIKVLPEPFAKDAERLQRFEREARSLASLNHPNVAQVYGIDEVDGTCFMAMELVPGKDLGEHLAHGPLPVDEALDVCRQIAAGLEAAHEAGVVHRDLKPANVRITPDGTTKVLDFGLARLVRPAGSEDLAADSVLTTEQGRLLGTPTYMAPEQARGKPIDRRVDAWAFGCVMYECLTGRRAFRGKGLADVLAAVLESEPDWGRIPNAVPARVRELLGRCLDKDPRTRLRDVGEARVLLERGSSAPPGISAATERRAAPILAGALMLLALGVGVGATWFGRAAAPSPAVIHEERITELVGVEETPAISPDGRTVAFVSRVEGQRQVWVQVKGAPRQITFGPYEHSAPRWVGEDTLIYFRHPREGEPGSLHEETPLSATEPQVVLASAQGEADVSHDRKWIATFRRDGENIVLVRVQRMGEKTVLEDPVSVAVECGSPRWSPDDRYLAYHVWGGLGKAEIRVLDLDRDETKTIILAGQIRGLAWLPDSSGLVYASSEGSTMAYPPVFHLRTIGRDGSGDAPLGLPSTGYSSYVEPDVSLEGRLVASRVHLESDVYSYPIGVDPLENMRKERRITWQTGQVQVPTVSPDGKEVAYLSDSDGYANIWVTPVDEYSPRQITRETDPLTMIGLPVWSPTEDLIVYWKRRMGAGAELWLVDPRETRPWLLVQSGGGASWSRDGDWVYHVTVDTIIGDNPVLERIRVEGGDSVPVREGVNGIQIAPDGTGYFTPSVARQGEVWKVEPPLDTGAAERLVAEDLRPRVPLWPHQFTISRDGLWLATPLRDDGTTNLWIISTEDGELTQVTDFGVRATTIGRNVSWSNDSTRIFAAVMETDADIVRLNGALP